MISRFALSVPMTTDSVLRAVQPNMGSSHVSYAAASDGNSLDKQPRMFKKHKVLPHPRKDDLQRQGPWRHGLGSDSPSSQTRGSPGSSLYHRQNVRRITSGPEPPPTPPAHSRASSSSHAADLSGPTYPVDPSCRRNLNQSRSPATPPNQTPPTPNLTPDRTPPGPAARQIQPRPPMNDRIPSKVTTDSRTESFITAPENPYSSDDDDGRSTLRPLLPSTKTSQSTVRQYNGGAGGKSQAVGLGLGLESSPGSDLTPRTAREFNGFDGEWASGEAGRGEMEEEWDPHLMRNVTVRKRRKPRPTSPREPRAHEVVDDTTVKPTNAAKALRSMSLQESPLFYPPRRGASDRLLTQPAPSNSESSGSIDYKRSSIMSTKSTASTVVEAILVDTAPQRRKTLRHVRKQSALRDSGSDLSPPSTAPTSVSTVVDDQNRTHPPPSRTSDAARESYASTATFNSISSRKARREVWKHGGIPVAVVPERRSSVKSNSREPSLRSTSGRRSRSLSSAPFSQEPKSKEYVPHFERATRRSRALSEPDGSRPGDVRTMDFPPVIPTRSSSLSAPTNRNASRTGSLTAESLKAHNMLQAQQAHHALQKASRELEKLYSRAQLPVNERSPDRKGIEKQPRNPEVERSQPGVSVHHAPPDEHEPAEGRSGRVHRGSDEQDMHETHGYGLGVDSYEDPFFGKRLSVQNTPFSVGSVDTAGTSHAEVSEAMAVNIYPHQSTSVVLVDHPAKPSESPSSEQHKPTASEIPVVKTTDVNGAVPVTPPQQFSIDDVDSPLRNPRAPPQPPAINFTPATPSGLTPTAEREKQLGNYYEMTQERRKRSLSLLRRTLSRRRPAEYGPSPARPVGLLTRTFSLSRNIRRRPREWDDDGERRPGLKRHSTADDMPADETRLHPFWRPSYVDDSDDESCSSSEEGDDDAAEYDDQPEGRTYRYPPIDNRPSRPRRRLSLGARIKQRTLAILPPLRDWAAAAAAGDDDDQQQPYPDRRTIRRTPSGNLRVVKFRRSLESLPRINLEDGRPYTAPEHHRSQHPQRGRHRQGGGGSGDGRYARLWRSLSLRAKWSTGTGYRGAAAAAGAGGRGGGGGGVGWGSGGRGGQGGGAGGSGGGGFLPALGDKINLGRRLSERRRERRTQELRRMISAPREVRDGVGDVIRRGVWAQQQRQQQHQQQQRQGT